MQVIAAAGIQVPMEDKPREYITDSLAVDVPASAYYLRILADGDLLPAEDQVSAKSSAKKGAD
jgi:hypothetical protein